MQESSNKGLIIGIIAVTVLIFGGLIYAVVRLPSGNPVGQSENVTFDDAQAPSQGPVGAKVVVHMYEDFQCPACKLAEPGVAHAIQAFKDRVLFVWKDFPLTTIHRNAKSGALAARCAQDQGKFWEYHDVLYGNQDAWVNESDPQGKFVQYAQSVGLNTATFTTCYANGAGNDRVAHDMSEGVQNSVDQTPTYFIDKQRAFAMSPAEWDTVLNAALAKASSTAP